jgi:hypothetical protein
MASTKRKSPLNAVRTRFASFVIAILLIMPPKDPDFIVCELELERMTVYPCRRFRPAGDLVGEHHQPISSKPSS